MTTIYRIAVRLGLLLLALGVLLDIVNIVLAGDHKTYEFYPLLGLFLIPGLTTLAIAWVIKPPKNR